MGPYRQSVQRGTKEEHGYRYLVTSRLNQETILYRYGIDIDINVYRYTYI